MTSLKDTIEEVWNTYASAFTAGDINRWINLWADDGIQMPPDAPANNGKEKIHEFVQNLFTLFNVKMTITNEETRDADNWGYARGTYTVELTPKKGGDILKGSGKYSTILEKQDDGSWKIARDCFNYNAPLSP